MISYPRLHRLVSRLYPSPALPEAIEASSLPTLTPDAMSPYLAPARHGWFDGNKFEGGFGATEVLTPDYWTLRARSTQLFRTNIYARGIISRLVTNVITTGLALEALPDEKLLGYGRGELLPWSDDVEDRFDLWAYAPQLCDYKGRESFGSLQARAKMAALISGDVLVVLHQDPLTGIPRVRLVDGSRVQSPFGTGINQPSVPEGHVIRHGVELDPRGQHVAYWILTPTDKLERRVERLAAVGPTGRRIAWLVYGHAERLLDDVRGDPILSIILQSLREVDRYREAVQRKATVNSVVAMFIKKEQEQAGSRPFTGGAVVRGSGTTPNVPQPGGQKRTYNFAEMLPGVVLDELAPGESPQGFSSTGTDERFGDFERTIVSAMAWSLQIPPEILTLSFNSNYSASQAAIQELRLTLQPWRQQWAESFCAPVYEEWLLSEVLAGRIKADGLLEAWRDPMASTTYHAWTGSDWTGAIKPHIDMGKTAKGYSQLIAEGLITRDRAAREVTGQKYAKNVARLAVENEMLAAALKPLKEAEKAAAPPPPPNLRVIDRDDEDEDDDDDDESNDRAKSDRTKSAKSAARKDAR